ncbi:hypothetical protein [Mesobacillus harenae]|uniref:hypothetical protein n=1 Tax=Mesobacillus harenae TaxID=2213203 RepID=UPI0015800483|nr:hypothetical protein [Mesobacillus harenae]
MDSVILVTIRVKGMQLPIKIASKIEPTKDQIYKKISDLAKAQELTGEIQFKKLIQEKGQKMYIYKIGERRCVVIVEKLQKIIQFEELD